MPGCGCNWTAQVTARRRHRRHQSRVACLLGSSCLPRHRGWASRCVTNCACCFGDNICADVDLLSDTGWLGYATTVLWSLLLTMMMMMMIITNYTQSCYCYWLHNQSLQYCNVYSQSPCDSGTAHCGCVSEDMTRNIPSSSCYSKTEPAATQTHFISLTHRRTLQTPISTLPYNLSATARKTDITGLVKMVSEIANKCIFIYSELAQWRRHGGSKITSFNFCSTMSENWSKCVYPGFSVILILYRGVVTPKISLL